jgi:hypothetical protein
MDRTVQPTQRPIPFNTPIVGNPWHNRLIVWKDPTTWHEPLSSWLVPMVAPRRKLRLKQRKSLDLCWDDPEWMERLDGALTDPIEEVVEKLAEDLGSATLETFTVAAFTTQACFIVRDCGSTIRKNWKRKFDAWFGTNLLCTAFRIQSKV